MSNPFRNRNFVFFFCILVAFLVTRFLAAGQLYHQDEYRWAVIANPIFHNFTSPHPPLTRYLLRVTGELLGFLNLRYGILLFGLGNLLVMFQVIKKMTRNTGIAVLGAFLYTVSVYSAIANLQIDIDGATLPFFVLLTYYAYGYVLEGDRRWWLALFGFGIVGGFLAKESFALCMGALIIDYFFMLYGSGRLDLRTLFNRFAKLAGVLLIVLGGLYFVYSQKSSNVIHYAEGFKSLNFASRAYGDLVFKVMKSLVWLSPLVLLPTLAGLFTKGILKKYRFWYIYLFVNSIFYLVLFDFSNLTVERYFMFTIIPCIIIASDVLWGWIKSIDLKSYSRAIAIISLVCIGLSFVILKTPHVALPLNPKSAYVHAVKHFDFNFLLPLTGGSGPVGFYFSASYILIMWLISIALIGGVMMSKKYRAYCAIGFLVVGIGYNVLFLNEYIWGSIFGSVPNVARESIEYIRSNPNITSVITYYDIGAYDLTVMGKYYSRFYTAPTRDYTLKLTNFRGQYMIVDFPEIDKTSPYWKLLERCPIIKQFDDKQIHSYIFDCQHIGSLVVSR